MASTHKIPATMQAWICRNYGEPENLELQTRAVPVPKPQQVLIKVATTTVDSADVRIRTQNLPRGMGWMGRLVFGLRRPRQPVLGTNVLGEVVTIGTDVQRLKVGDRVVGLAGAGGGAHAQYCCVAEQKAVPVPEGVSDEHAIAVVFGGLTALHFLRSASVKSGERVLVIGASGAVGVALVQLAVKEGAVVTAMTSQANANWVAELGANKVVDYHQSSLQDLEEPFDIIADTVAATHFAHAKKRLREHGRYLPIAGGLPDLLARSSGTRRSVKGVAPDSAELVEDLLRWVAEGKLKAVIHEVMAFSQLREAHRLVETGHKRGSLVIRIN
ncbi:MAG: NAD(P)-dependent alcohol dehydrogenase [Saccharospirillum sp.]|nr:NAD(P)-dependent alcohol dehydrogenase [Saccharospirillum sp.]